MRSPSSSPSTRPRTSSSFSDTSTLASSSSSSTIRSRMARTRSTGSVARVASSAMPRVYSRRIVAAGGDPDRTAKRSGSRNRPERKRAGHSARLVASHLAAALLNLLLRPAEEPLGGALCVAEAPLDVLTRGRRGPLGLATVAPQRAQRLVALALRDTERLLAGGRA